MAPKLHITDRDGFSLGMIEARSGLVTRSGRITRVSEKSIWTEDRWSGERLHRSYDGRLPAVPFYKAPKAARLLAKKAVS